MPRILITLLALSLPSVAQDLPESGPLLELPGGAAVVHGTDPGDFYCEHAFFVATTQALRPESSILRNGHGEPLVGFLHVPHDEATYDAAIEPDQAVRHADLRRIVGAAIRGWYAEAAGRIGDEPFRLLLTGYAQWGPVVNNPSGDFVVHPENVEAAMARAFGDALAGTLVQATGPDLARLEFQVHAGAGMATVVVETVRLPVCDEAIDGRPGSLQGHIEDARPHAVLSLGVAGDPPYRAEFHADDGGLAEEGGTLRHDDERAPARNHPDNYALARALRAGDAAATGR